MSSTPKQPPHRSASAGNEEDSQRGPEDEASRLTRWSRRKQLARGNETDTDAVSGGADAESESVVQEAVTETQEDSPHQVVLTDADMPDIASLTPDSDFKPFMSKGVSHALRRKALRKLFASPFFQLRDGLDDYDDDFTSFAPLGDTVTADMKYAEKYKEQLRKEAEQEEQEKLQAQAGQQQSVDGQENEAGTEQQPLADESEQPDALQRQAEQRDGVESSSGTHDGQSDEMESETKLATVSDDPDRPLGLQSRHKNVRGESSLDDIDEDV